APLMLVSLGMTLVIAVGGIDISVGAVVAISGAIAASLVGGTLVVQNGLPVYVTKVPLLLALLAAVGAALVCGMWNGLLVAGAGMQPIIATLILMVAGRG
ncbi:ABC transporter permease subunit, partial [Staphylococcus aureus]